MELIYSNYIDNDDDENNFTTTTTTSIIGSMALDVMGPEYISDSYAIR